jgi:hypothetical protein
MGSGHTDRGVVSISVYVDAFGSIYPQEKGIGLFGAHSQAEHGLYGQFVCEKEICHTISASELPDIGALCSATTAESCNSTGKAQLPKPGAKRKLLSGKKRESKYLSWLPAKTATFYS